jgi:opacity protein-like surface antigen
MRRFILVILLFTTVAASAQTLTVMQLLQSPRQFEGRRVTVSGYYYSDWEGHGIFADRRAAESIDTKRGIWVAADPNVESSVRKAQVIGVFFYSTRRLHGGGLFTGHGVFGLYPASLVNATVHLH